LIVSDLEVTTIVSLDLEADNETEFECLLPFDLLNKICGISGVVPMMIKYDGKDAFIEAGHDKYEMHALEPVSEYPKFPEFPDKEPLVFDAEFVIWLNNSIASVSTDNLRPAMTKICLDIKGTSLTIVTTDAHTLFTKSFDIPKQKTENLIISPKVAKALVGFEITNLFWNDTHILFKSDNTTILAKRCEEKFPNYRTVIKDTAANVDFNRADLITGLEKVSLTAGSLGHTNLLLKAMIGAVRIESSDDSYGRNSSTELVADYTGNCDKIGVNAGRLIKALQQVHFENVSLAIEAANTPILIKAQTDPSYTGLIIPLTLA